MILKKEELIYTVLNFDVYNNDMLECLGSCLIFV